MYVSHSEQIGQIVDSGKESDGNTDEYKSSIYVILTIINIFIYINDMPKNHTTSCFMEYIYFRYFQTSLAMSSPIK